ncbi:MAG: DNA polymerase III subunit gamma/tau, partial [Methylococcales bacterium]|nr:DNA polymerase III subunit gamma/tau [Methylococcales bacterium]
MAYQVLARKWRPQNFNDCVGQEHVTNSLQNALQHQRLHHAYLFTGTRGVGKTTIARILAKAINCEQLNDFNPCGKCAICDDFNQGRFMDLIEVDAASRTKVEDTRDLLDNAQYAPNQGRYKVYLIDEVHMLSTHSFNALLKTLEEPPPHVKFLLATTDPQKIPVTVLSRCLQFNLKALLPTQIEKQMAFILSQEKIEYEASALNLISQAADGSMRDGLSLLDQAIVFGQGQVTLAEVSTMLGTVNQQPVDALLRALISVNPQELLEKINDISALSVDFIDVLQQLLKILHRVALLQMIPTFEDSAFNPQMLSELAILMPPEDVQLYYQMGLVGQKDLTLAPNPRMGFEMLMLRMLSFKPQRLNKRDFSSLKTLKINTETAQNSSVKPAVIAPVISQSSPTSKVVTPTPKETLAPETPLENTWADMIQAMGLKMLTKELANNCNFIKIEDNFCYLEMNADYTLIGNYKEKLEKALQQYYQKPLQLRMSSQKSNNVVTPARQRQQMKENKQSAAVDSINNDENVNALKEHFDARILPETTVSIETLTTINT